MDENVQAAVEKALAEREAEREAEQAAAQAEQEKINAAVKMALAQSEKQFNEKLAASEKARKEAELRASRLPLGGTPDEPAQAPHQAVFADTRKADTLSRADTALAVEMLRAARQRDPHHNGPSSGLLRALAIKMAEDKGEGVAERHAALKAAHLDPHAVLSGAIKSDEINYSTLASNGDDWVGVEYSRNMWEAIRLGTFVLQRVPSVVVPEGSESIIIPVESTDPTWYKVAQAADENGTTKRPDATVTSSKLGTTKKTLSVAKVGARTQFTGELIEDSLIPWAAALRRQLEISGAEIMEHLAIDGDTDASNATNINDIDGTPAATEVFLTLDGFRKLALVTTTANSRSASGSLTDTDFLETVKLMGTGGLNAMDKSKVEFILDLNTHWKALQLASVKTRDVFGGATIENGVLTSIWGYPVRVSANMHRESAKRMAESTGKIDQTDSDNTTGAILAVRYDQWLFGYKRRMQLKLQEFIDADVTQIVALARVGMVNRDGEASAITYNVGL